MAKLPTQVTEPTVVIQRDKYRTTKLYVLPSDQFRFRIPKVQDDKSPRAWRVGPAIVVETADPHKTEVTAHFVDDPDIWEWVGNLMRVGQYALDTADTAAQLPSEMLSLSARFGGMTDAQRETIKARQKNRPHGRGGPKPPPREKAAKPKVKKK